MPINIFKCSSCLHEFALINGDAKLCVMCGAPVERTITLRDMLEYKLKEE